MYILIPKQSSDSGCRIRIHIEQRVADPVDEITSFVTFYLNGRPLGIQKGVLKLLDPASDVFNSSKWMIKSVDDDHFKIFSENGTKSLIIFQN